MILFFNMFVLKIDYQEKNVISGDEYSNFKMKGRNS